MFMMRRRPRYNVGHYYFKKERRVSPFAAAVVALPLATFTAVFLAGGPPETQAVTLPQQASPGDLQSASFTRCSAGSRSACVFDGDTIWLHGTKIRIADINTPEVSEPGCAHEAELGSRATDRLITLLNDGNFALEPTDRDEDRYGRKLRIVTRGGESLGETLVDEGLAEEWTGSRRDWCGGA